MYTLYIVRSIIYCVYSTMMEGRRDISNCWSRPEFSAVSDRRLKLQHFLFLYFLTQPLVRPYFGTTIDHNPCLYVYGHFVCSYVRMFLHDCTLIDASQPLLVQTVCLYVCMIIDDANNWVGTTDYSQSTDDVTTHNIAMQGGLRTAFITTLIGNYVL
jgi:hypothetical protein